MQRSTLRYLLLSSVLTAETSAWTLRTSYTGNNYADFFNKFSFWTAKDTTGGTVQYVSQSDAWSNGLIGNGGNIYIGVDDKNVLSGSAGRKSVRLTSNEAYQSGTLVVADISHMPGGICGTWPAFCEYLGFVGPRAILTQLGMTAASDDWPQQGEIDIIEEANTARYNQMSLHVSNQQGSSRVSSDASMSATKDRWGDCTQEGQGGCDANSNLLHSFGSTFNKDSGGIYAMEWTSSHIRIYFFPRDAIPSGNSGPLGSSPDPSQWGTPQTSFEGSDAHLDAHVKNQRIVINTDFCGTWASGTWSSSGCASSTGYKDCPSYVRANPKAFTNAFWTFNSLNVYRQ